MNKKKLMELLAKKEARKAEIAKISETNENVTELRGLNTELDTINAEISELRTLIDAIPDDNGPENRSLNPISTYGVGGVTAVPEQRNTELEKTFEKRGADLKNKKAVEFAIDELPEFRATTIGGGTLVVPKNYSNTLNPTFQQISSVIDMVSPVPLPGGESYTKGYEVSIEDADVTTETGTYNTTDPVFGYVEIAKCKVTAYAEITDEASKMPNVNYQAYVGGAVAKSLRKKISKMIVTGAGGANALTGIFNAAVAQIPAATDISISAIDQETLNTIVFGYGGDESTEGQATLILSKKDLAGFAAVKNFEGENYYQIKLNGATGTITSDKSFEIPFVISSAAPVLSAAGTASTTVCMAYGNMENYELPLFSNVTVEESKDFKFGSGQIAYRATAWTGGNVAAYKGFVKIRKA